MTAYLDAAATSPVRREALEAMWPYLTGVFGNPSSRHERGRRAAAALAEARARVAAVLGCRANEVVFTSGGTEGANVAITGLSLGRPRGRHVLATSIEHEAVLGSIDALHRLHTFDVAALDVDGEGRVEPSTLTAALREDSTLVSVGLANNEVGTVQDVTALAGAAHAVGALVHTDAVQAAGWLPLDVGALGVDALTISGHKVGAPPGTGAAFLRGRLRVEPVLHGGGQERGRRSGTENVPGAVALATALELAEAERGSAVAHATAWREELVGHVLATVPGALLTGSREHRLPGHASFCFPGTAGEAVLLELERRGLEVSSGSACAAGRDEPSHVLLALGIEPDVARTAVRLTLPHPGPVVGSSSGAGAARVRERARAVAMAVADAVAAVGGG